LAKEIIMTHPTLIAATAALALGTALSTHAEGDAQRGSQAARARMACHSFQPGRHLTAPSLAGVLGRKAGTAEGFIRYSDALKRSGIGWDEKHLDTWLADPQALVPGTTIAISSRGRHRNPLIERGRDTLKVPTVGLAANTA
jgi:cytochrome c